MLEVKQLTKLYKNNKGIKNVNLKIDKNEIVAILGPNGSGKSTLIKSIFSELKIDQGQIMFNGDDAKYFYNKMSFFTDQSLFPKELTLNFFCMYSAELAGINKKEAIKRTNHLLENLDLLEYKNKKFKSLSAGMQKRAMLAASLINDPEYIFLDEPTANLDIESRKSFINLLKNMAHNNKSVVITSHIIDELQNIINRVILIKDGKILLDSKFDSKNQNLEEIYFSVIAPQDVKNYNKLTEWN